MNNINIKMLSEDALNYMKLNIQYVTDMIVKNPNNNWIYECFPQPMFVEKNIVIKDFIIQDNPNSENKHLEFENSKIIYETLNCIPRYILTDEKFWLWLYLDKFYMLTKNMMKIKGLSTIRDHWMHGQGKRRGIFFGVLSRCYFRVELTIDDSLDDKYELTKWISDNPERFRNLAWRSFSSEKHLVRGIIKAEKKAVSECQNENMDIYPEIAKFISIVGSVMLLDAITEEDIEKMTFNKCVELLKEI